MPACDQFIPWLWTGWINFMPLCCFNAFKKTLCSTHILVFVSCFNVASPKYDLWLLSMGCLRLLRTCVEGSSHGIIHSSGCLISCLAAGQQAIAPYKLCFYSTFCGGILFLALVGHVRHRMYPRVSFHFELICFISDLCRWDTWSWCSLLSNLSQTFLSVQSLSKEKKGTSLLLATLVYIKYILKTYVLYLLRALT